MSWPVASLGEIAGSVDYGITASANSKPVGPKFLRITDIQDDKVDWASVPFCDADARKLSNALLVDGDIVFARTGATTGKSFLVRNPPKSAVFASYLIRVRPSERLDSSYLSHFFRSPEYWNQVASSARGAAQPGINATVLKSLMIPVAPITEQRRIAAILDKADVIRRRREQALNLADDFLRSVFLEMFGDPLTNAKKLPRQPLGKFGRIVTGNTPPRSDSGNFGDAIEWIKSDNVNTNEHFLTRAVEGLSDKGRILGRIVPKGSILVTCIAGSPSSIGRAAIANRPVAFNQQINAIIPNPDVNVYFLYVQFLIGKQLVMRSSTNSMKGMISKGEFQKIEFLRPDPDEQARFGRIFEKHLAANNRFLDQKVMANDFFAALSQRAFAGDL